MEAQILCSYSIRGGGVEAAVLFSLVSSGRIRVNGSKLCQERFRLDTYKHFFTERVAERCTRLPREVADASSLSVFEAFVQYP